MRQRLRSLIRPYLVRDGRRLSLSRIDPGDTGGLTSKAEAKELLTEGLERLHALQERLYAQDRWGVLLIFQAMDAAGKDGAIKHVMSGVDPKGCQVFSFKRPSDEELDHDFLWRCVTRLPERGRIGIFNRSYYEDVLVVRVRPALLDGSRIPRRLITPRIWRERFEDINALERYLSRNGYAIRKFFLHVSPAEQLNRFEERLDEPAKNWKFAIGDLHEHLRWSDYMRAYRDAIRHTASPHAPWVVVPADNKWYARLIIAAAIVDALESLGLDFPPLNAAKRRELGEGRKLLTRARRQLRPGSGHR